ncbi:MAG TPA: hypothetical protein VN698_02235 [Bacteroidia bacterium]|nr:hypothetical protein [Bacteroidia bacterium]
MDENKNVGKMSDFKNNFKDDDFQKFIKQQKELDDRFKPLRETIDSVFKDEGIQSIIKQQKELREQFKPLDEITGGPLFDLAGHFNKQKDSFSKKEAKDIIDKFGYLGLKEEKLKEIKPSWEIVDKQAIIDDLNIEVLTYKVGDFKNRPQEKLESKKESIKFFWRGALVSIVAALIGITPTIIEKAQGKPQDKYIVLPKNQIIHDTVFVKK